VEDSVQVTSKPTRVARRPPGERGLSSMVAVVRGALVGVAGVYLATHSVVTTVIAAVAAVILAGFSLLS
jgi:hypothetical protein